MKANDTNGFTQKEWEDCIKVLKILKDNPLDNPDNQLLGTLITKIYKQAKKGKRAKSYSEKREKDLDVLLNTTVNKNARAGVSLFADKEPGAEDGVFTKLEMSRQCYCCNQAYDEAHFFYARLCPACAVENYAARFENADLTGRKVILTGGRVKIGYATALRLLRNNATVVVTTRFPGLAWSQFEQEEDYHHWKENLIVYGLDLRNLHAIQAFVSFYTDRFDSVDILINNAAQTIQYPADYYLPIIAREEKAIRALGNVQQLVENKTPVAHVIQALDDQVFGQASWPLNRFGQPVDFRDKTSWNSTLDEISVQELLEVNLINQIAPYLLIKELKPWFKKSGFTDKFIVNVTSSEGLFSYENKTKFHPHTNMTKAALNMLTRTSAGEFARDQIYMSCVDVGWISTGAKESLRIQQFEQGYIPPLDAVDGASRIFHPILKGLEKEYLCGVLLKNYKVSDW